MFKNIFDIFDKTKSLRKYISRVKPLILLSIVCFLVTEVFTIIQPLVSMYLIDEVFATNNKYLLNVICLSFVLLFVMNKLITLIQKYFLEALRHKILYYLRADLFKKIMNLSINYMSIKNSGYMVARFDSDTNMVQILFGETLLNILQCLSSFIIAFTVIVFIDWHIALLTVVFLLSLVICITIFNPKLRGIAENIQEKYAIVGKETQESFGSLYLTKTYMLEKYQVRKYANKMKSMILANIKSAMMNALSAQFINTINGLAGIIVMWIGGAKVINGDLTLGQYFAITAFMGRLYMPIIALTNINQSLQISLASLDRIIEIDKEQEQHMDKCECRSLDKCNGNIEYKDVTFSYENDNNVLCKINLKIVQGSTVAIIGKSGAGKTTLINLLLKLYMPGKGAILIDDININELPTKSIRRFISVVPQETILFSDSIKENIRIGNLDATDEDIVTAAKLANAHDFITKLSEGYNTHLGERGFKLSGGEKQRIAIARAIIKNPSVLILDEATSQVDNESERQIQVALNNIIKDRTTIIIAHRFSTIKKANKIVLLENGQISEYGTHNELSEKSAYYNDLLEASYR